MKGGSFIGQVVYDFRSTSERFLDLQFNSFEFFKKDFDFINCRPKIIAIEEVDQDKDNEEWDVNSVVEYLEK